MVSSYDPGGLNKCNAQVGGTCYICLGGLRFYDSYTGGGGQKTLLYLTSFGSRRGFGGRDMVNNSFLNL